MASSTRSLLRPRTLARTIALAAAAALSLGATAHAHEQGTHTATTADGAASVLVYEIDTASSQLQGRHVESGDGSLKVRDGTATIDFEMRTAANDLGTYTRMFVEAYNFVPPAPGESKQVAVSRGGINHHTPNGPGGGIALVWVNVVNVDGAYEVRAGGNTVAVFAPV
ncbi:MAG: hypothetical protein AAGF73_09870 [Actinomycetota bacterium]